MEITCRRLQPHESALYRAIRLEALQSFPDSFTAVYAIEKEKFPLAFEQFIAEQHPANFMVGAFDHGNLIGICGFTRDMNPKIRHHGTLIQMYVRREYHGKQVGRKLLDAAVAEAFLLPEIMMVLLGVVSTNENANRLYEKAGFREYGFFKNYCKSGDGFLHERLMMLERPV
jgi:diamine N-acetyltransferase